MFEAYQVIRRAELRDYTTLKLGGRADYLAFPACKEDVCGLLQEAKANQLPVTVMGRGSNLLVRDGGVEGLVILLGRRMSGIRVEGRLLHAQAGAMLGSVAAAAAEAGLSGLEFASGIPGTAGGAVTMNAGAYEGEMSRVVLYAEGVLPDGSVIRLDRQALDFGYRRSGVPKLGAILTEVTWELSAGEPETIRQRMQELNRRRAEKQPLDVPSAGSTFKRPEGYFASALIDQCGLKGYRVGEASVSTTHAGFLINRGHSSRDFLELMATVQRIVQERTGVWLEPEVKIIGREEAPV